MYVTKSKEKNPLSSEIMHKPCISVIMTTYQRPRYITRAINSVIAQNFTDWELLVIDDCSKDNTRDVVKEYMKKDKRIRYIRLKENYGTHTRPKNIGTAYAKADLIAYLDDDNSWRGNHLHELYTAMQNTGADIVYGDRWVNNTQFGGKSGLGVNIDQFKIPGNGQDGLEHHFNLQLILQRNYIDTNDVLLKKKDLEYIGGWAEEYKGGRFKRFADWNLFVRLGKLGKKFIRVAQILTDYYLYQDSNQLRNKDFLFNTFSCPVWLKDTFPKKVAVFTITKDRLEYTKRMMESIHKFTNVKFDHFFYDNGSTDGTVEYLGKLLEEKKIHRLIVNKDNTGISHASNVMLDEISGGGYDWILKVDNDCEFLTPNWLETMLELLNAYPRFFIGPYVEGLIDNPGGAPRLTFAEIDRILYEPSAHVGGICNIASADLYRGFRWKDKDLKHGLQDLQLSQYAIKMGYQPVYLAGVRVEHMDSTIGQKKKYKKYFELREKEKKEVYEG